MAFFQSLKPLPDDPIFALPALFAADKHPQKVNLGIGIYKDSKGKSKVFDCVKNAEFALLHGNLSKDYLPIDGDSSFVKGLLSKIFNGIEATSFDNPLVYGAQALGGTGALRLGAEVISRLLSKEIFIPDETWPNHALIFNTAGMHVHSYPYYDVENGVLKFDELCSAIKTMPAGSVILLHACCHNPTGIDPSIEQWKQLSELIMKQKILPFFDFAYQGLGNGFDEDSEAVRHFYRHGHEMLIAYSCSKNFGLYGERVGMLAVVSSDMQSAKSLPSNIKPLIRSDYSNPPLYGARIAASILQSPSLTEEWQNELCSMRCRCDSMRHLFVEKLSKSTPKRNFASLSSQKGLFSFCRLSKHEVTSLRQNYGIIMPDNGRINVAALTENNIDYVVNAIAETL